MRSFNDIRFRIGEPPSGVPVAEIRPFTDRPKPKIPDREALIMSIPHVGLDSGEILEQDRR